MSRLSVKDHIYLAISYRGTSVSTLARAMGMPQQNLCRKINSNTLKKEDLCKIARVLGAEYVSYFAFPGGIVLGDSKKLRS